MIKDRISTDILKKSEEQKRLFFGLEILSPWAHELPKGRCLEESNRHLTLAFLGQTDYSGLEKHLDSFPKPPEIGFAGRFDRCLFLPEKNPHVIAWHVQWQEQASFLTRFQQQLNAWLKESGFFPANSHREFLPHVTICRQPFAQKEWKEQFRPLPLITGNIHLYESLGNLHYQPCWTYPITLPFEEIEHTADIAFLIHGISFQQLHSHAQIALAFKFPNILPYLSTPKENILLEDIVIDLNNSISRADQEIGSPLKAVSFHDKLTKKDNILTWEMIVDV